MSPALQLPVAVTLPYSYQSPLPLRLPPASSVSITSPSGNVSQTPAEIIHACHMLLAHLQTQRAAAETAVADWEGGIAERELMEKRRVAPGYLDTGIQILEPTRKSQASLMDEASGEGKAKNSGVGDELDRVFGKMGV